MTAATSTAVGGGFSILAEFRAVAEHVGPASEFHHQEEGSPENQNLQYGVHFSVPYCGQRQGPAHSNIHRRIYRTPWRGFQPIP